MDLFDNPFGILGATAISSRSKLMELFQEKSLFEDSETCTQARLCLTTPKKRLQAEISWFFCSPDLFGWPMVDVVHTLSELLQIDEDASVEELCAYEDSFVHLKQLCEDFYSLCDDCLVNSDGPFSEDEVQSFCWLSVLNLSLTLCQRFTSRVAFDTADRLYENSDTSDEVDEDGNACVSVVQMLLMASSSIDLDELFCGFNTLREKSGFPQIDSQVDLSEAWNEHLQDVQHELMRVFELLPSAWLSKILCQCLNEFDDDVPFLLRQVIDQYELGAKSFFDQQLSFISKSLDQATVAQILALEESVRDKYLQLANKAIGDYITILKPIMLKAQILNEPHVKYANKLLNVFIDDVLSGGAIFSKEFELNFFNDFSKQIQGIGSNELEDNLDLIVRRLNEIISKDRQLVQCLEMNGSTVYVYGGWISYQGTKYCWNDCTEFSFNPLNFSAHLVFCRNASRYEFNFDFPNLESCEKTSLDFANIFVLSMARRWKRCLKLNLPIPFNGYTIWNEGMEHNLTHNTLRWADMMIVEADSSLVPGFKVINTQTNTEFAFFKRFQDSNIMLLALLQEQIKSKPRLLSTVWTEKNLFESQG